jgi:stage II sporulation protein D
VLPAEYPFTEIEGAKAQAIVIRSYAEALDGEKTAPYALRDDIGSQVYMGVQTETEFSRSVANLTAGSVMLYNGEVVEAVYSSNCGGHSANNEDIWGSKPIPYLRGRKDPYDRDAPGAEWESEASVKSVHEGLSRVLGERVKGIKVAERGKGDHVRTVEIDIDDGPDESVSGERFRSMLNGALGRPLILSSKFEIRKRSGDYFFEGRGHGHGVGFCQWGAAEQARQGRDFDDILTFYYKDVDISEAEPEVLAVTDEKEAGHQSLTTPAPEPRSRPHTRTRRPGW